MNQMKSLALAFTLIVVPLTQAARAQATAVDNTAKVKSEIAKRLDHKKTRVKIKLRSGDELKGQLDQAGDDNFTLIQDKTGKKIELAYTEVSKVSGRGMSTFAKVGIVAAVAAGVLAVAVIVALKNFDPFSGGIRVP
jgi:small nuclear ribonucleoprotein (snRNP)-like protein